MGLRPTLVNESQCHREPFACHSERREESAVCPLWLNFAKDLRFRCEANTCRFFAALRMTDFQEIRAHRAYSWRSTSIGSTRVARPAGAAQAASATAPKSRLTPPITRGSEGRTP